jgi:hypothetical protein
MIPFARDERKMIGWIQCNTVRVLDPRQQIFPTIWAGDRSIGPGGARFNGV